MKNKNLLLLSSRIVLFIVIFGCITLFTNKTFLENSKWWTLVMILSNIITILTLFVICKKQNITYKELIKYKKQENNKFEIAKWSIIIILVSLIGMYLMGLIMYQKLPYTPEVIMQSMPLIVAILNIIFLPITTIIAEEGLYLGIGINTIKNKYLAIIITVFFFALQHSFLPLIIDFKYMLYRFLSFIPVILLMCIYYYKSRKIVPIMIGHFIINFATMVQILLLSL